MDSLLAARLVQQQGWIDRDQLQPFSGSSRRPLIAWPGNSVWKTHRKGLAAACRPKSSLPTRCTICGKNLAVSLMHHYSRQTPDPWQVTCRSSVATGRLLVVHRAELAGESLPPVAAS